MIDKYILTALFSTDGDYGFDDEDNLGLNRAGQIYRVVKLFDDKWDCIAYIAKLYKASHGKEDELLHMVSHIVTEVEDDSDFAYATMTGNYEGTFLLVQNIVIPEEKEE